MIREDFDRLLRLHRNARIAARQFGQSTAHFMRQAGSGRYESHPNAAGQDAVVAASFAGRALALEAAIRSDRPHKQEERR